MRDEKLQRQINFIILETKNPENECWEMSMHFTRCALKCSPFPSLKLINLSVTFKVQYLYNEVGKKKPLT